jgi:hypothetical protein
VRSALVIRRIAVACLGSLGLVGCSASPTTTPSAHTLIVVLTIGGTIEVHARPHMVIQPTIRTDCATEEDPR